MFRVGDYHGVGNPAAWGVGIVFFLMVEPQIGLAVGGRHVGEDEIFIGEDVVHFSQVHPGAVDTTGRSAFGEVAALKRFRVIHAGVEVEGFGHGGIVSLAS
jgi:hypothetical protein